MPFIPIVVVLLLGVALIPAMPILLFLRYRAGTMRRRARKWAAMVNLLSFTFSAALFVWVAALTTTFWLPNAFPYSLTGLAVGALLGLLGLAVTRWEVAPGTLHYTPNRWLVLVITLAVAARLLYGLWRIWHAWRAAGPDHSWLAAAGVPGSMAVGGVVIGYYLVYFAGVRLKLARLPA